MAEAVVLGDLELDRLTGLAIEESRKLSIHPWPGADGDLVQDMGMAAARIWLTGVAMGGDAGSSLEAVRGAMQDGKPLDFAASAAIASGIEQVLVSAFYVNQPPGRVDFYEYRLELVRYVEPPPPPAAGFDLGALGAIAGAIDTSALDAIAGAAGALGTLDGALSALGDAMEAAQSIVEAAQGAMELVETALQVAQGLQGLEQVLSAAGNVISAFGG